MEDKMVRRTDVSMSKHGVEIQDMDQLARFASMVAKSKTYKQWTDEFQIAVVIQTGLERGMTPVQSLSAFYCTPGGAPRLTGEGALALLQADPRIEHVDVGVSADAFDAPEHHGFCHILRRGANEVQTVTFSVAEAKRARLWGTKAWAAFSDDMLVWKAVARASRRYAADVLGGIGIVEDHLNVTAAQAQEGEAVAQIPAKTIAHDAAVDALTEETTDADDTERDTGRPDGGGEHQGAEDRDPPSAEQSSLLPEQADQ